MALRNTQDTYGSVSKSLHWLIFLLIVAMLIIGLSMDSIVNEDLKHEVISFHKSLGLLIFGLIVLRIVWALINPKPRAMPNVSPLMKGLMHAMHGTLYLLMLAMPITGWLMSTAARRIPSFFGLFSTPTFGIAKNRDFAHMVGEIHEALAWVLIVLVVLHILAALKHHYIDKDTTLIRMMPSRRK